tara:strand:+ start:3134 stop:3601 length:468 start_codon:yes stop_codon:yes gene_type:complete
MENSVKIIKNLKGEFVGAQQVKEATQKEYNQNEWNKTIDSYSKYDEVRFFKTKGSIYEFDYYAIYVVDGMRFLQVISYGSSLSSGGFAFGFFTEGNKDPMILELMAKHKELEGMDQDSLTILEHSQGRIATHGKARQWMREQTLSVETRFFTKAF